MCIRYRCTSYFLGVLFVVGVTAPGAMAGSSAYTLIDLGSPADRPVVRALATDGTQSVGYGSTGLVSTTHALLWSGTGRNPVDLNPAGFAASRALGVAGGKQVGYAWQSYLSESHAFLWAGSAELAVDLNPSGFSSTKALGIDGARQVGSGNGAITGYNTHALMWSGTPESVVDLNPQGYGSSEAKAIHGDQIVGNASLVTQHAFLWNLPGHIGVDLHPGSPYVGSYALSTSGTQQVGYAETVVVPNPIRHAMLWFGSAASYVDLNPTGFSQTVAMGVANGLQVGYGYSNAFYDPQADWAPAHALLWSGTAESVVDLSTPGLWESYACGITDSGVIIGYGLATPGDSLHAVMWVPTPEPASILLLTCAGWVLLRRRMG